MHALLRSHLYRQWNRSARREQPGARCRARDAGRSVALIDHRPFGGACALRGCDPKKVLVSGEEAVDAARRMKAHGVAGELTIDWKDLIAFKRSFTDPVPAKQEQNLAQKGIDGFHGVARFTGPGTLDVNGETLQGQRYSSPLAPGRRPWISPVMSI